MTPEDTRAGDSGEPAPKATLAPGGAVGALPPLQLRRGEDRRLRAGHLWIYSNEVDTAATPLGGFAPGALVRVMGDKGHFLGTAYVNPHALICARILSRSHEHVPGRALLVHRLQVALALRERHYPSPHYRLVHGESDGLPGLVIDRYGDVLVAQAATAGMEALRPHVEAAARQVLAPRALVWKNDTGARDLEQLPKEVVAGIGDPPDELEVVEGVLRFRVPLAGGQKTGWFYDQGANRELFRRLLWPGARVLDVCSYAGGWAVTAMRCGASEATCVDASESALACAQANARLNEVEVGAMRGDAFDVLESLQQAGERYDVVVLDPPAFIKRRKDHAKGLAAYRKLNQLAMRLLTHDALLVSCSCSWHLEPGELLAAVQAAARHTGRFAQLLASGGQSPDHPVHPAIPETRYLKGFFVRVTRE